MPIGFCKHRPYLRTAKGENIVFSTKAKQTISMQQATQFRIPTTNLERFSINETDCINFFKKSLF
jgi:hypothetical protein